MLCCRGGETLHRTVPRIASGHPNRPLRDKLARLPHCLPTANPLLRPPLLLLIWLLLAACSKPADPVAIADVQDWTCAMHPSVHSQKPGKCPICGMDLIPVTHRKEESSKTDEFIVPIQRQQQTGVTYAEVRSRQMRMDFAPWGPWKSIRRISSNVTRVDGYIEGVAGHFTR